MANPQDLLNQYLNTAYSSDGKQQSVSLNTEAKKQAISDKQAYAVGAAAITGLGQSTMPTQEEADLVNLTPYEVIQKYGQERGTALLTAKYQGTDAYLADENASRDALQTGGDLLNQAISGFVQTVGGIGALGLGLVSDDAGAAISGALDDFNRGMGEMRSDASTRGQEAFDARSALREQASTARYNEEIADGSPDWAASLARIGSDAAGAAGDVLTDPAQLLDLTAQGVGSMAAIPVIAGELAAAVPLGVAGRLLAGVIGPTRAAVKAGRVIEKALPATAAIGLTESGGTFVQATNEVMNMSPEQLSKVSPEFNDLVAGGMTPEDARAQLANDAGTQAALTQLPAAIVAGSLVHKFEASPGARRSVTDMFANLGKETFEEGTQSATSQLAVNQAIKDQVDATREVAQGVGTQLGVGAVAGMGAAGAIQAPGVIAGGVGDAATATKKAVDQHIETLRATTEKQSPVSKDKVTEGVISTIRTIPTVKQALDSDTTLTPEQRTQYNQTVQDVLDVAVNFNGDAIAEDTNNTPVLREAAKGEVTQIGLLQGLTTIVNDENRPEADRVAAMTVLSQATDGFQGYLDSVMTDLGTDAQAEPVRQLVSSVQGTLSALKSSPDYVKASEAMAPLIKKATETTPLTENSTPEEAAVHLAAAELSPESATPENVATLLKMASSGKLNLTDSQRQNLQALRQVYDNAIAYDAEVEAAGATPGSIVSTAIKTGTTGVDGELSALQHIQGIKQSLVQGDREGASLRLADLGMFAQHMQNKVNAYNEHMQQETQTSKNSPTFQKLVGTLGNRSFVDSGSKIYVQPKSEQSVRNAQLVTAEANFVTKTFNTLAETFPELGLEPMPLVELDPRLAGNPAEVAQAFNEKTRTAGPTAPKATPKPAAKKAPEKEPVAEQQAAPQPVRGPEVTPEFEKQKQTAIKAMSDADLSRHLKTLTNDLMNEDSPRKERMVEMITAEQEARAAAAVSPTAEVVQEEAPVTPEPVVEPVVEEALVTEEVPTIEPELVVEDVAVEPETEVEQVSENPMMSAHPGLVGGENNIFIQSFKLPMNPISNLDGSSTPIRDTMARLKDSISDSAAIRGFQQLLVDMFPAVLAHNTNQLNRMLLTKNTREGDKNLRQHVLEGRPEMATYYPEGRTVALTHVSGKSIELDQNLMAKAHIATVNWLLNGMSFVQSYDVEQAAKVLGIDEDAVTQEHLDTLSRGVTRLQAIDALAHNIQRYWGVTPNSAAIDGYTKGLPQAVAANMIDAMLNQTVTNSEGNPVTVLTQSKLIVASPDGKPKTVDILIPIDFSDSLVAKHRSAIEKATAAKPELVVYMGENKPPVATTQMNNPAVPNTPEQIKMIENQNATGYRLNPQTWSVYQSMGVDAIVELFGEGVLDPAVINKNDLVSKEGRNTNIVSAWNTAIETVFSMGMQAEEDGIALEEVDVHFGHNITSVGRAQQLGRYTPQSSKLMRTLLLPTNSKPLNLTDVTSQDYQAFMLAMGQLLGEKVHNLGPAVTAANVEKLVNGVYKPVIEVLQDHLANGRTLSITDLNMFKSVLGKPTFEKFQALVEYALFLNTEDKSAYTTQLYLEADGMSNGPFNAMAMFTLGGFTPRQLKNLAKCGLYIGGPAAGQTSWVKRKEDTVDLYGDVAIGTKERVSGVIGAVKRIAETAANKLTRTGANNWLSQQKHLNRMMSLLLPDMVKLDKEGNVTNIQRGLTKNPTTITTYGSGKAGIAGNITDAMLESLYSKVTDALKEQAANPTTTAAQALFPNDPSADEKLAQLDEAMQALTTGVGRIGKFGPYVAMDGSAKAENIKISTEYTISRDGYSTLSQNVRELLIEPMSSAIHDSLGETVSTTATTIRMVTQIQGILFANAFAKRVNALLPKPGDANYVQGGYLSQKQQQEIFQSLAPLNPFVEHAEQTYLISGSEKVGLGGKTPYGASFNNKMSTAPTVYAPFNPGVKGIATLTIGPGDGKTIQLVSQDPTNTERAVFIFDGINYPLDFIQQGSVAANQAALAAIMGNPLESAADSFTATLDELVGKEGVYLEDSPELRAELEKALAGDLGFGLGEGEHTLAQIMAQIDNLASFARENAIDVNARHNVLSRVNLGMDQMAAAGSPYLVTDKIQLTGTDEEIANQLTEMFKAEVSKLRDEAKIAANKKDLAKRQPIVDLGIDTSSGAVILTGDSITGLVSTLGTKVTRAQVTVLTRSIRNVVQDGYKVIAGSYEQLMEYNRSLGANGIDASLIDPNTDSGMTLPDRKEIWLLNADSEVLAHEMIHASTYMTVLAYMQNKFEGGTTAIEKSVADSIDALESLMQQFLDSRDMLFGANPTTELMGAYESAHSAITNALSNPNMSVAARRAVALNEYMAWALANQELAVAQSKVPVKFTTLVWETVKKMRDWLIGPSNRNTDDMLSNLAYHTKVVMAATQPSIQTMNSDTALMQSSVYGHDQRLADVTATFDQKVTQYLNAPDLVTQTRRANESASSMINAHRMMGVFSSAFPMTGQEGYVFSQIVAALGTQMTFDANIMNRMQELYSAATRELTPESFMKDPQSNDPNDYAQGLKKFDTLMGKHGIGRDAMNRTTLLPSFMALAVVNEDFRNALSKLSVPRTLPSDQERSFDRLLENQANKMLDGLSDVLSGQKSATNITQAVDNLTQQLIEITQHSQGFYDQYVAPVGSLADKANGTIVEGLNRLGTNLFNTAEQRRLAGKDQKLIDQAVNSAMDVVAAVINEDIAGNVGEAILAGANASQTLPKWLHDLVADLVGRVDSNADLYDMIKKVRSSIQRLRNQFRTELPKTLAKQFTRAVTAEEWTTMHSAIGKSDLASLVQNGNFTRQQVLDMLSSQAELNRGVRKLEDEIKRLDSKSASIYMNKAKQLATFMMTGIPGTNLQRNAHAIARQLGSLSTTNPDPALERAIDSLVSLYALDQVSDTGKQTMASLVKTQKAGVEFTFGYALGLHNQELARLRDTTDGQGYLNHYKGHMPNLQQDGVSLIIADDAEYSDLVQKSYVRVGSYDNSTLDPVQPSLSYYFAPVNGRSVFNQGILQNVRQTVGGVDSITGYTVGGVLGGRITSPKHVKRISMLIKAGHPEAGSNLLPVFGSKGEVVAYERAANPAMLSSLNMNTNFAEIMGAWKGRLAEETLAVQTNAVSIETMAEMYRKDINTSQTNQTQYVNLFSAQLKNKYPVIEDALSLFTPSTIDAIHAQFPNGEFWVRKDMLDNVIGYRSATVGDAWTGNTYWSKDTQETIRKAAMLIFGNKAYAALINAEQTFQGVVQDAKTLIIVKSMVVPVANIMSNMLQLVARGVPTRSILVGLPKKLAETRQYVASEKRAIEAEAELHASTDPAKRNRLRVEIQSIRDSYKRMSIWPLIERGELSSMSDDAQPEDVALTSGKLNAFVEAQVNKLPPAIRAAGKYALITKDTALYKGLRKSVEYGDFLAKAILWDDLVIRQGKDVEYANGRITEEFVNFDRLGGRNRQYLEAMGLLWFYNFKIRSAKVGLSMIRNNPLHALIAATVPVPASIGSPITDNLFSQLVEGQLGHSIGLGQLISAPMLHPVDNMLF